MKHLMNSVPRKVIAPKKINIYPTLSSPTASIKYGVPIAIPKFTVQFITTAIPSDLSCIISAMYSHVIGPDEISKNSTNSNSNIIGNIPPFYRNSPSNIKIIAYKPDPIIIRIFLPAFDSKNKPRRVPRKLTSPIKKLV